MNARLPGKTGWVITAAALALIACGDQGNERPAKPSGSPARVRGEVIEQVPPAIRDRLRTEPVAARVVPEVVTAPGEVALDLKRVAKVSPRIEGKVEHLNAFLGDRVRVGQPLAAIGSLRLDELVQEYLVSKAQTDATESNFRRTEKLAAEGIVSDRRLVEERGRHLEAKARYQHVREKLLNMGLTQEELRELEGAVHEESHRYVLRSPLAGTVVKQNVVLGQGVSPGSELFEIVDTSRVWVFANLPLEQARRFKPGDIGTIMPKGSEPVKAPLSYLSPIADETTRTIRVRLDVSNPNSRLKPNEFVEVRMTFEGPPTLAVPASAVTVADKVCGVFVQRATGYAFVPIEVGREGGGWVEVRKGLTAGERVVIEGVFDLKNVLLKEAIQHGEGE
jgi:cobalt-zinc-cadmium efflux system membrane fusion protein